MERFGETGSRCVRLGAAAAFALLTAGLTGCANPGPPKPPSLQLPSPPRDLSAERTGATVELRFTAPRGTTDKLPLRATTIRGTFCRQEGKGPCVAPPGAGGTFARVDASGRPTVVVWQDTLPADVATGPAKLLCYRIELFNASGRSAGPSDAAYTIAGAVPRRVEHLVAEGSRKGVVLHWAGAPGDTSEVLLRREGRAPLPAKETAKAESSNKRRSTLSLNDDKSAKQEVVWMSATPGADDRAENRTLDASAALGVSYHYQAVRRATVKIGARTLELRSELSDPVEITVEPIYAAVAPTGLVAAAFSNGASPGEAGKFAVDLVWQPVDDADVAGYNVYRERIDANGAVQGANEKLTSAPVREPGFHDATAKATVRYRYSVTAMDTHGNESTAVTTIVEPSEVQ